MVQAFGVQPKLKRLVVLLNIPQEPIGALNTNPNEWRTLDLLTAVPANLVCSRFFFPYERSACTQPTSDAVVGIQYLVMSGPQANGISDSQCKCRDRRVYLPTLVE